MAKKILNYMVTFRCKIFHDKDSQNLLGLNFTPRYWVVPQEFEEVVDVDLNPLSVTRGFVKDGETGWYLKNIDGYNKERADIDLIHLKNTPPYGYDGSNYETWFTSITNKEVQDNLEEIYKEAVDDGLELPTAESMRGKYPFHTTSLMDILYKEINTYKNFDPSVKAGSQLKLT